MVHLNPIPKVHVNVPLRKVSETIYLKDIKDRVIEDHDPVNGDLNVVLLIDAILVILVLLQLQHLV